MTARKPPEDRSAMQAELLIRIENQLDAIEAAMRRIGFWSADPPDLQAAIEAGQLKSYLDAPTFELWLQQVFLPNAREAVRSKDLPKESSVGLMAMRQYDYHSHVPEAHGLLALLFEFDELVEEYGGGGSGGT